MKNRRYGNAEALVAYERVRRGGDFAGFAALLHDADRHVARNAAWVLTKASDEELLRLHPMLHELMDLALNTSNTSLCRLTLNIIHRLPLAKEDVRTDFLDFCLEQMAHLSTPPGTQALCMKIAHRLCGFYPELAEEFRRTVEGMDLSFYKPAVKCTVRHILSGKKVRKR
ncbi:MAG: hypothetical protein Q4B68_03705 [Bacteroidales bacterium]|nr:hypothetical protein [Bacteroidales bacterium]